MVRIRLRRVGSAHQPHYRVVVADQESPRDGRYIEIVGHYNPKTNPGTIVFDDARIFHWLSVGAQPSESVQKLFKVAKLDDRYKRFKAGEDQEALVAEAKKFYDTNVTSPVTAHPAAPKRVRKAPKNEG